MKFIVTGGAGFIGSALIRHILSHTTDSVVNLDKLTYAGNLFSLEAVEKNERYYFEKVDICDRDNVRRVFEKYKPDIIINLAAESHVDRSIDDPGEFIKTNVYGTYNLLEVAREYKRTQPHFRFHHVSTDEVYGDLKDSNELFSEDTPYSPSSPYSASKASSDHLVRAWSKTFNLNIVITNCSNNYGPYHFPEKLIPHMILNALNGKPLPIYGNGQQIRDWLYVEDHARALYLVATKGNSGETYNIGGNSERKNIEVVQILCDELQRIKPRSSGSYHSLITYVEDRPGHDLRYAVDTSKINRELGWHPMENFESGMRKTVEWYIDNEQWWSKVLSGNYRLQRIGSSI